jgi:hypothetical protein
MVASLSIMERVGVRLGLKKLQIPEGGVITPCKKYSE